jgi:hypothetical protein
MLAWHVPFLGWCRFPADLSEFEIAHFFTLKPIDIRAVRSRYKESLRLQRRVFGARMCSSETISSKQPKESSVCEANRRLCYCSGAPRIHA